MIQNVNATPVASLVQTNHTKNSTKKVTTPKTKEGTVTTQQTKNGDINVNYQNSNTKNTPILHWSTDSSWSNAQQSNMKNDGSGNWQAPITGVTGNTQVQYKIQNGQEWTNGSNANGSNTSKQGNNINRVVNHKAVAGKVTTSQKDKELTITYTNASSDCHSVELHVFGENAQTVSMHKNANGVWSAKISVKPGTQYQYKFTVNKGDNWTLGNTAVNNIKTTGTPAFENNVYNAPAATTSAKKQEVTHAKKQEVTPAKKQEVTPAKKQEVTPAKKQETTHAKKQEVKTEVSNSATQLANGDIVVTYNNSAAKVAPVLHWSSTSSWKKENSVKMTKNGDSWTATISGVKGNSNVQFKVSNGNTWTTISGIKTVQNGYNTDNVINHTTVQKAGHVTQTLKDGKLTITYANPDVNVKSVQLHTSTNWNDSIQMTRNGDVWSTTIAAPKAGDSIQYKFTVNGTNWTIGNPAISNIKTTGTAGFENNIYTTPAAKDSSKTDSHKTDSHKTDSHKADSHKADSSKTDSHKADSSKTDSHKADSSKTDSHKADSSKTDSSKTDSSKTDSSKTASSKTASSKTASSKTTSSKTASSKTDSSKTASSKTDSSKTDSSTTVKNTISNNNVSGNTITNSNVNSGNTNSNNVNTSNTVSNSSSNTASNSSSSTASNSSSSTASKSSSSTASNSSSSTASNSSSSTASKSSSSTASNSNSSSNSTVSNNIKNNNVNNNKISHSNVNSNNTNSNNVTTSTTINNTTNNNTTNNNTTNNNTTNNNTTNTTKNTSATSTSTTSATPATTSSTAKEVHNVVLSNAKTTSKTQNLLPSVSKSVSSNAKTSNQLPDTGLNLPSESTSVLGALGFAGIIGALGLFLKRK